MLDPSADSFFIKLVPTILFFIILLALYLNILATFTVFQDTTLQTTQRISQIVFIWIVPFICSLLFMHLSYQLNPKFVPLWLVPWPFRKIIMGRAKVEGDIHNLEDQAWTGKLTKRESSFHDPSEMDE